MLLLRGYYVINLLVTMYYANCQGILLRHHINVRRIYMLILPIFLHPGVDTVSGQLYYREHGLNLENVVSFL